MDDDAPSRREPAPSPRWSRPQSTPPARGSPATAMARTSNDTPPTVAGSSAGCACCRPRLGDGSVRIGAKPSAPPRPPSGPLRRLHSLGPQPPISPPSSPSPTRPAPSSARVTRPRPPPDDSRERGHRAPAWDVMAATRMVLDEAGHWRGTRRFSSAPPPSATARRGCWPAGVRCHRARAYAMQYAAIPQRKFARVHLLLTSLVSCSSSITSTPVNHKAVAPPVRANFDPLQVAHHQQPVLGVRSPGPAETPCPGSSSAPCIALDQDPLPRQDFIHHEVHT